MKNDCDDSIPVLSDLFDCDASGSSDSCGFSHSMY